MRRIIDCPCGHRLTGETDEDLFHAARRHVTEHHPEMQRGDEELRGLIRERARDDVAAEIPRLGRASA